MTSKMRKVGIITLSLPREKIELAKNFGKKASKALESVGFQVIKTDELIFETDACINAAKRYVDKGAECIILLLGTWVFAPTVVDTVKEVDIPFGVWAEDNPALFPLQQEE